MKTTTTSQEPVTLTQTFTVSNRMGLRLRPAQSLVHAVTPMDCQVWISKENDPMGEEVNGKSILGIAMLEAICGTRLTIRAIGPDAARAMQAITQLFQSNFGEEG